MQTTARAGGITVAKIIAAKGIVVSAGESGQTIPSNMSEKFEAEERS